MKMNTASTVSPSATPITAQKLIAVKTNLRAGIAGRTGRGGDSSSSTNTPGNGG